MDSSIDSDNNDRDNDDRDTTDSNFDSNFDSSIDSDNAVAIIGMAGRFPGAASVAEFWNNIAGGVESITTFTDDELLAAGVGSHELQDPEYVRSGAVLDGIDLFDAEFFGLTPRECQLIDPQQRLFLETVWTAMESAGFDPTRSAGPVGVFAGSAISTYLLNNIVTNPAVLETASRIQVALGNDKDSLSTWTAYAFDLQGPSYTVQSYCSTSLVAVSAACTSLVSGECDVAIAGGAAISVPHRVGYRYQEGGIASPDGRCRAFDAKAKGAPLGNGVGVVVLKRLSDAITDGDHIHAVIRGWAVNNDGAAKAGFTAPGVRGQAAVMIEAMDNAGVTPDSIGYIETHGTGTALGDAVEFAAMRRAFASVTEPGAVAIGSVKTNVGHLDRAAGVTGLIKATLSVEHATLPPTLHFTAPNPQLDMAASPFTVQTRTEEWVVDGGPRRAGVSAFGIGGTNAHVVLEQAPQRSRHEVNTQQPKGNRRPQLLPLSARSTGAVNDRVRDLGEFLTGAGDEIHLADVAWTLQTGRKEFEHRRVVLADDVADAAGALTDPRSGRVLARGNVTTGGPLALVFAGVGEHYQGWAAGLYESEAAFRQTVDECCGVLDPLLGVDLRTLMFGDRTHEGSGTGTDDAPVRPQGRPASSGLDLRALLGRAPAASTGDVDPGGADLSSTAVAQPAVFVVEYALAELLASWGIRPEAVAGYSVGEYVAATVAGVLSLPDALALVAFRARLIAGLPAGAMLAIGVSAERVPGLLADAAAAGTDTSAVDLAAANAPEQCVVSGPVDAIDGLIRHLLTRDIPHRRLDTSHAFHSRMLRPIAAELTDWIGTNVGLQRPLLPLLSNVTGEWMTDAQATDPGYFAEHMTGTVQFSRAMAVLLRAPDRAIVDIGPGPSLSALIRQQPGCTADTGTRILPVSPGAHDHAADCTVLHTAVGKLWLAGQEIDWAAYQAGLSHQRVPLPTYPFQRASYWIDPPALARAAAPAATLTTTVPSDALPAIAPVDQREPMASWLQVPAWIVQPDPEGAEEVALDVAPAGPFLVFVDDRSEAPATAARLAAAVTARLAGDDPIVTVRPGQAFSVNGTALTVRPDDPGDYRLLAEALEALGHQPRTVVHLWGVTGADPHADDKDVVERHRRWGFGSIVETVRALSAGAAGQADQAGQRRVLAVTDHRHDVDGSETLAPGKSAVQGALLVVPQEFPDWTIGSVDFAEPPAPDEAAAAASAAEMAEAIVTECIRPADLLDGTPVAYRSGRRLTESFAPVPDPEQALTLRENGTYLLTGGLGAVGLLLAEHLAAKATGIRLVLTGRTGLPDPATWTALLELDPDSTTAQRIRAVQRLHDRGAQVLVLALDAGEPSSVDRVVTEIHDRFGPVHGVIHGAGRTAVEDFQPIQLSSAEVTDAHFAAKVDGLLAVERALAADPLDFWVLQSSISSVLGGLGFAAYSAANAVLDAVARTRARAGHRWLSIDWDTWRAGSSMPARSGLGASMAEFSMTVEEGLHTFDRALAIPAAQIVVSTGDLAARQRQWGSAKGALGASCPLPAAGAALFPRPELAEPFVPPSSPDEQRLAGIWQQTLGLERVGIHDNFFDLGGTSLIGLQLLRRIGDDYHRTLSPVSLFEAPTVASLAALIGSDGRPVADEPESSAGQAGTVELETRRERARVESGSGEIAIIGMAGRFPGAGDVGEFWQNLCNGVESISFFTDDELDVSGVSPEEYRRDNYVKARPVMDDIDAFDAEFFGYSPREAELTDPQHRVFLECSWHALEDAGYAPRSYPGRIGVFAGTNISTYLRSLYEAGALDDQVSDYQAVIGNDKDALTTTVSYKLDLTGPSLAVQTFCSTSLVATHLAVRSLRTGESDMVLAGGVSIRVPDRVGYLYTPGGMESPDGHVRTFDAQARGAMFGDGAAVVVLKRLADAVADGDNVYAVIKGSAVNNDGSVKVGFTAPSVIGQTDVVSQALRDADVDPASISYVEAHGTGTPLGDPIEMASLTRAFGPNPARGSIAIGSVKTNVGHLDRAAGVTGLIKTALSLQHNKIPATLHFTTPNPQLELESSPFHVNAALREWTSSDGRPRRAGVNSLGMGGTNVHVVLEEAPPAIRTDPGREDQLLVLSARTSAALDRATADLAGYLRAHPTIEIADVAWTLQVGREHFEHRRTVRCRTAAEAIAALDGLRPDVVLTRRDEHVGGPVTMVFGDASAVDLRRAREITAAEPAFRQAAEDCRVALEPLLGPELLAELDSDDGPISPSVDRCAGFVAQFALAGLLASWGVEIDAVAGQGLGKLVAATVAGILPLRDALALLVPGAGGVDGVDGVEGTAAENITAPAPRFRFAGPGHRWLTDQQVADPAFLRWLVEGDASDGSAAAGPIALPADAARTAVLLGRSAVRSGAVGTISVSTAPDVSPAPVAELLHRAVAELWTAGHTVSWSGYHHGVRRNRIPLPTYPFQRSRFWVGAAAPARVVEMTPAAAAAHDDPREVLSSLPRLGIDDWFYQPTWRQAVAAGNGGAADGTWLVFADTRGVADEVLARLGALGRTVVRVDAGPAFRAVDRTRVIVRPGVQEDYGRLLQHLTVEGHRPHQVLHLWSLDAPAVGVPGSSADPADPAGATGATDPDGRPDSALGVEDLGYASVLWFAQALGRIPGEPAQLVVVSTAAHDVTGLDVVQPDQALLNGPARVIPLEFTDLSCRLVDVLPPESTRTATLLAGDLLGEFDRPDATATVAWRGGRRWTREFQPLPVNPRPATDLLRDRGVYLITGGLGGIGMAIAQGMAESVRARLVLLAKSALPARAEWDELGRDSRTPPDVLRRIQAVTRLESTGAEVLVLAADVADPVQLGGALAHARERFGPINGVVHAAGVPGMGLIQMKTPQDSTVAMRPKVTGTAVLLSEISGDEMDFVALFSSITSATGGGPGQVDYCAANSYLDAVAAARVRSRGTPLVSIGWGEWQWNAWGAGLSGYAPETREFFEANRRRFGIGPEEGWQAFLRAMGSGQPHVVVSTQDFRVLTAMSHRFTVDTVLGLGRANTPRHARPDLATPFIAPAGELETTIADLWCEALGVTEVGVQDNFFELGGNSLLGVDLVAKMCRALDHPGLAPHVLYVAPTVSAMAAVVSGATNVAIVDDRRDRGSMRRDNLRHRRSA